MEFRWPPLMRLNKRIYFVGGKRAHDQSISPKRTPLEESKKQSSCFIVYVKLV